ncbi:hypothetical protein B0H21DRAFT_802511 [Amylocystis lapponica]|nr:hypothetical protein B0H21DRAFT_802511 [Amylocystis lapponica]
MEGPTQYYDIDRIRSDCPCFRILIIGRANSGKTTILQKVCNAKVDAKPIVYNQEGKKISSRFFKMGSQMRGEHDIEHQITYKGSGFIFHDSCGFEAGSANELEKVVQFISKRSSGAKLKDQLHIIWYCIPMDNDRPFTSADELFFQKYTEKVPVIVIFTKFDALKIKLWGRGELANADWNQAAMEYLQQHFIPQIQGVAKAYIHLSDMHIVNNQCPELTEKTAQALDNTVLLKLFVMTQKNNINLLIKLYLIEQVNSFILGPNAPPFTLGDFTSIMHILTTWDSKKVCISIKYSKSVYKLQH